MRITYEGGWKGYVDLDEHLLVWTTASPSYRGELPIRQQFHWEGVDAFVLEDIGIGDDFWDWVPDN